MRIEKVNDTQIRCTLTKEDLEERQLKLSELAYGTERAKNLFREMMQQASFEFGFEAENIPVMIEAIPLSTESIILLITKVEYPEELDTRFSQFSAASEESMEDIPDNTEDTPILQGAEDLVNLINKVREMADKSSDKEDKPERAPSVNTENQNIKLYSLDSMSSVLKLSECIAPFYRGENELYHDEKDDIYFLVLHKSSHSSDEFNRICNILPEYANNCTYTTAIESYIKETSRTLIDKYAVQTLNSL